MADKEKRKNINKTKDESICVILQRTSPEFGRSANSSNNKRKHAYAHSWMYRSCDKKQGPLWVDTMQLLLASPIHTLVVKHAQKKATPDWMYGRDYPAINIDWRATWKLHPDIKSTKEKHKWSKSITITIQNLKRELREACVLRYNVLDLDMVAAHVAIVRDLLEQNGAPSRLVRNASWYLTDRDDILTWL